MIAQGLVLLMLCLDVVVAGSALICAILRVIRVSEVGRGRVLPTAKYYPGDGTGRGSGEGDGRAERDGMRAQ